MLFGNLTVRETFRFAANVRLPAAISQETRMQARACEQYQGGLGGRKTGAGGTDVLASLPAHCGIVFMTRPNRFYACSQCHILAPSSFCLSSLSIFLPPLAQLVEDVISELALGKAADTFVGNAFVRGVSGGERK